MAETFVINSIKNSGVLSNFLNKNGLNSSILRRKCLKTSSFMRIESFFFASNSLSLPNNNEPGETLRALAIFKIFS